MNKKKKLIFVLPELGCGGAERVILYILNYLDKTKYDVTLVLFKDTKTHWGNLHASVRIICLNKKNRWDFIPIIMKLKNIINITQPDTVVSFLFYTNIVTVLAALCSSEKCRVIISERNYTKKYLSKAKFKYLKRWLIKYTYKKADLIITNSILTRESLHKEFGIQSKNLTTIYNPVSIKEVAEQASCQLAEPILKNHDTRIIISVGRLVKQKRIDRLLRSFALVRKTEKNTYLIIVGEGNLRKKLERLSVTLGIEPWVHFVGYQSNPYSWMAQSDVFVLASDYEGFPNVIIESMAAGLPVISTDCPSGPGEIIKHGLNGLLVHSSSNGNQILADTIIELLKDKKKRELFAIEGKKRARDFECEKILPQFEQTF